MYACIACSLLTLIVVGLITLMSWNQNKRADRGEVELEYFSVSATSRLVLSRINKYTGTRPEGFQVHLLMLLSV